MNELFDSFDTNKNGFIDKEEFFHGMKALYGGLFTHEKLEELFKKCDRNDDKKINYQGFYMSFLGGF